MKRVYNRYIPQSDGTFHRRPVPRQPDSKPTPAPPKPEMHAPHVPVSEPPKQTIPSSVPGFLRQLLPKDFDTGDLLIVLLLLLMAGDSEEEKSNALLTLALYFFM